MNPSRRSFREPGGTRRVSWERLAVFLAPVLAGACATAGAPVAPAPTGSPPALAAPRVEDEPLMRRILTSPPEIAWEVSRLLPESDYLHFPRSDGGPGFFLTPGGYHFLDPGNFLLRYERSGEGFRIVEVRKRAGTTTLAECPVYFPVQNCVEQHYLMLATVLSCTSSCSYRFVVFDSHSPFPIALHDPVLPGLVRILEGGVRLPFGVEVKYEESGLVFDTDEEWAGFIRDRFAFIAASIRAADKPLGFRLLDPPPW